MQLTGVSSATYEKRYADRSSASRSLRNHRILSGLPVARCPAIERACFNRCAVQFELIAGTPVISEEHVLRASAILGAMHAQWCARADFFRAQLESPHETLFSSARRAPLEAALLSQSDPDSPFAELEIERFWEWADGRAQAFYKDSNVENFVIAGEEIFIIDFDTLTTAPLGYDLAKLLLTHGMRGRLTSWQLVRSSLDAYNAETAKAHLPSCEVLELHAWLELNWLLTRRHVSRKRYVAAWPALRSRFSGEIGPLANELT